VKIQELAVLVGMGVAFSGMAQAAVYIPPPVVTDYYFGDITNTSVSPSNAYTDSALTFHYTGNGGLLGNGFFYSASGQFEDYLHFDITHPVIGTAMVSEFPGPIHGITKDITGMQFEIWQDVTAGADLRIESITDLNPSGPSVFFDYGSLSIGSYYLKVSGTGGANGGMYTFSAATVPVPEVETWAMLLAGLGLVGLQLRRKSKMSGQVAVN